MENRFRFHIVNNTNLHPLSHRFRDTADYWSNFQCRQGPQGVPAVQRTRLG